MKRVLVVDDDPDIRQLISLKLKGSGLEVHLAGDGDTGLAAATELVPDIILLDVTMPKMNGIDVCRELRAHELTRSIAIIMLTARSQEGDVRKGFEAGADDYLVKPFNTRSLQQRLNSVLARNAIEKAAPKRLSRSELARTLISMGTCTDEQIETTISSQRESGLDFERALLELDFVTGRQLADTLALLPPKELLDFDVTPPQSVAVKAIPEAFARREQLIGLDIIGDSLRVGMANPTDVVAIDDLHTITGREIEPVLATSDEINKMLDQFWLGSPDSEELLRRASEAEPVFNNDNVLAFDAAVDEPVVAFVNELLSRAIAEAASDIHLEPTEQDLRVRFRIDGVARDVMIVPRHIQRNVISRLKIMGDMNIAERRLPQDGRVSLVHDDRLIDIRLVTLPTVYGEAIVMRILDRETALRPVAELGFRPRSLERYIEAYERPHGAILIAGPTGSGKSTTLYAALRELNDPSRNIVTIEDPIEYRLDGIKQILLNTKAGLTFASALRSILRSDPDVILVGEIRDGETARLAIEAALTGHKVLSSLHANSAASTPARLIDMGLEPYLVVSALSAVLAQRLLRRLCECKQSTAPLAQLLHQAGWSDALEAEVSDATFYTPVGCDLCGHTGYKGRFAAMEVLRATPEIGDAIINNAPTEAIEQLAIADGMLTMANDGLYKAARGETSLEEVIRVVPA